jgi:hypothetical protein
MDGGSPVTEGASTSVPEEARGNQRLAILLAMAMFVLVVDTSLMNRAGYARAEAAHPWVAGYRERPRSVLSIV